MGGGIVTNFALRYPDRVLGPALIDPGIYGGANSGVASALVSLPGIQRWGQHIVRLIWPITIGMQTRSRTRGSIRQRTPKC